MQNFIVTLAQQAASVPAAGNAAGQTAAGQPQTFLGSLGGMLPMIIVFAVIIYLMYRSQKKEQKRRAEMLDSIKAGDKVLMVGGIYGEIVSVKDDRFVVKIADNVKIDVVKTAISTIVGKEEQK